MTLQLRNVSGLWKVWIHVPLQFQCTTNKIELWEDGSCHQVYKASQFTCTPENLNSIGNSKSAKLLYTFCALIWSDMCFRLFSFNSKNLCENILKKSGNAMRWCDLSHSSLMECTNERLVISLRGIVLILPMTNIAYLH